jgi:hypothetical protein
MKQIILVFLLVFFTVAAAAGSGRKERIVVKIEKREVTVPVDEAIGVGPEDAIVIRNSFGSLRITGWDRKEVHVKGMIGKDVVRTDVEKQGGESVVVDVVLPDAKNYGSLAVAAELEISVPRRSSLDVSGIGSDIDIEGVDGAIAIRTIAGTTGIVGAVGDAPLSATSISGAISIKGPFTSVRVGSVTGDILVRGVNGGLEANSTSGMITVENALIETADLTTGMGDISIDCSLSNAGTLLATTNFGGAIELTLQEGVEGRFTLAGGAGLTDISSFQPAGELKWVFEEKARVPVGDISRIVVDITERIQKRVGDRVLPGTLLVTEGGLTMRARSIREFTVGNGGARVFLESQSFIGNRGEDSDDESSHLITLRTR